MAEGVVTTEGKPVELDAVKVDQEFARAMAADVSADVPAPPRKPVSDSEAPKPRRGRPPKSEQARVSTAAPAASKTGSKELPPKDYAEALNGLATGAWLTLGSVPYTSPYAGLIRLNQVGLVAALNQGAQQNTKVRAYVEKATTGGGGLWMVQLGMVGATMASQALQLARDPELRKTMAEKTQSDIQEYLVSNQLIPAEAAVDNGTVQS